MGSVLSGILGTKNDFQANTGGQNFGAQIAAQQAALGNVQGQQQNLAQALQQQSQGIGANPAQAMLNQASDRNIKQNAGMIASQKSINPALAQRLIAQNAANAGQEAAAQGATMGAQQQLAAQGQLSGLYNQMAGQNLGAMGQYQSALANVNNANANVAAGNQQTNTGLLGGLMGGVGSYLGMKKFDGGMIPGKPVVSGDHPVNDTVPAMLSPGEIVVPRSKANNPKMAKEFIDNVMNKGGEVESKKEVTYADVLAAQKELQSMIKSLKGK